MLVVAVVLAGVWTLTQMWSLPGAPPQPSTADGPLEVVYKPQMFGPSRRNGAAHGGPQPALTPPTRSLVPTNQRVFIQSVARGHCIDQGGANNAIITWACHGQDSSQGFVYTSDLQVRTTKKREKKEKKKKLEK